MPAELNLSLVRSLRALVEEGHFGRAAERLHVTPSAMTQQVRRLEESVGARLVDRSSHPVRLTDAGAAFMRDALIALEHADRAMALQGPAATLSLRIGFIDGSPGGGSTDFVDEFRELAPEVSVDFKRLTWPEQVSAVAAGAVDASLVRPPLRVDADVRCEVVFREPRVVVADAGSRLAALDELRVADLDGHPVFRAAGVDPDWTRWWNVDPRPSGVAVEYAGAVGTIDEAVANVAGSNAILVTAESVARRYVFPGVVQRPLVDASPALLALCTRAADRRAHVELLRERGLAQAAR